jgi:hypothetical protein
MVDALWLSTDCADTVGDDGLDSDIDAWSLTRNSVLQGFGLGIVFTPLQVVAFATLPSELRTDGTALFSLLRSLGLAIGVSREPGGGRTATK